MPAAIAEVEVGKPMMAYQGEMPWHRLGTKCDSLKSVDAALKAAHLDWKVKAVQLGYQIAGEKIEVPRKVLVRADKPKHWLSTVGMDYTVIQNEDAFAILEPACKEFGITIETAGALGARGDRLWMLAKLPDATFQPVHGDRVDGYFLVVTGHNGWTALTARPTPVRVVCANTLAVAVANNKAVETLRHTESGAARLDEVAELVTKLVATLKETNESFTRLAERKLTPTELRAYVDRVLGIDDNEKGYVKVNRRDAILGLAANGKGVEFAPSSAWTAFNAVTEYIDHVQPAQMKVASRIKSANTSALFGTNAKLKTRALDLARQLAA
jgi:phage/plasmid-like protein (TIGR03299 family)